MKNAKKMTAICITVVVLALLLALLTAKAAF